MRMNRGLIAFVIVILVLVGIAFYQFLIGLEQLDGGREAKPQPPVESGKNGSESTITPPNESAPSVSTGGTPDAAPKAALVAPCDGWKTPSLAILLSGEQNGSIEPCGCSLIQLGGMSRRMDLYRMLADRGWMLTGLDLGGTLHPERPTRQQSRMKFDTTLSALKEMKYAALALGRQELLLGLDLVSYHIPDELPFISANAGIHPPDLMLPLPYKVFEVGGVKVGVTSVLGDELRKQTNPAVPIPDDQKVGGEINIVPASEGLATVVPKLVEEKCDLLVLLSHGVPDEAAALAKEFPQFQVVVSAGGPDDPDPKPKRVGETLILAIGKKGKHVGVLGVYPAATEPGEKLRFELVDLDKDRFPGAPRMRELMQAYVDQVKDANLAAGEPAVPHPTGRGFVGAQICGECHTKAFAAWKLTKHSHGLESLDKGRKGEEATWISRSFDPECLACHVAGWNPQEIVRYEGGFLSQAETPHLAGQQCENCHGPGDKHTDLERGFKKSPKVTPDLLAERKAMHLDLNTVEIKVCTKCHDGDNSPGWNFQKYWPQVRHVGRD